MPRLFDISAPAFCHLYFCARLTEHYFQFAVFIVYILLFRYYLSYFPERIPVFSYELTVALLSKKWILLAGFNGGTTNFNQQGVHHEQ